MIDSKITWVNLTFIIKSKWTFKFTSMLSMYRDILFSTKVMLLIPKPRILLYVDEKSEGHPT